MTHGITIRIGSTPCSTYKLTAANGADLTDLLPVSKIVIEADAHAQFTKATLEVYVSSIEVEPGALTVTTVPAPTDGLL